MDGVNDAQFLTKPVAIFLHSEERCTDDGFVLVHAHTFLNEPLRNDGSITVGNIDAVFVHACQFVEAVA